MPNPSIVDPEVVNEPKTKRVPDWTEDDIKAIAKEVVVDETKKVIESGKVENAKPLYFHPITIYLSASEDIKYVLTMIIINNQSEAFTKTSLIDYIKNSNGRFLVNGSIWTSTYYLSPAYVNTINDVVYVIGVDNNGNEHNSTTNQIGFNTLVTNATLFNDNVNKIN